MMKPEKYPQNILRKVSFFFAFGLIIGISGNLFAFENEKIPIENQTQKSAENDTIPFFIVDEVPRFQTDKNLPNNQELLRKQFVENIKKHVQKHIYYPENQPCINGRVFVTFVIDKKGFAKVKETRSEVESLKFIAREIIEKLPKLIPAKHEGKNVNCIYHYPILFKIN